MMQMRSMLWMPACSLQAKRLTLNLSRRYLIRQTTPISYCPYHIICRAVKSRQKLGILVRHTEKGCKAEGVCAQKLMSYGYMYVQLRNNHYLNTLHAGVSNNSNVPSQAEEQN